ncbi:MAG: HNH endonuclease [Candidatus Pacebacteria bacterium]|nr:HNH endonuclease [Candidatus Paceibacterota bacterium]
MKFELTNGKHKISDLEYLNDLRKVANHLKKNSLKMRDYCKENGALYSVNGVTRRFGNWTTILEKAGLKGEDSLKGVKYGEKEIKEEVLLADLVRVSTELNKPNISCSDYDRLGKYTVVTMGDRFGSWNKAKEKAKLKITKKADNSDEDLFNNILELWTLLGRQPKFGEVVSPNSKYHGATYARRFGSWKGALEAFVEYINNKEETIVAEEANTELIPVTTLKATKPKKEVKRKRTTRNINLRLRFNVLQRDNFKCKKCGRAPATNSKIVLHVDHIKPWSKGGETVIENLQSLCSKCNLGKSNLE